MTSVFERILLDVPYVRAREYLHDSLPDRVSMPMLPGAFEKNVRLRYERGRDPLRFYEPWTIMWTPDGGGPYPNFSGQIMLRGDSNHRRSVLELRGGYEPPLGPGGRVFDLVAGSKIASATARRILQRIGEEMRTRYDGDEEQKCSGHG